LIRRQKISIPWNGFHLPTSNANLHNQDNPDKICSRSLLLPQNSKQASPIQAQKWCHMVLGEVEHAYPTRLSRKKEISITTITPQPSRKATTRKNFFVHAACFNVRPIIFLSVSDA
jgi:hypothetical protein